jgi:transposase-like protein
MAKATVRDRVGQGLRLDSEGALRLMREELKTRMRSTVLEAVGELLEEERRELMGEPWSRKGPGQARSGGTEGGSIYLEGRRVPVRYHRVAATDGRSAAPPRYRALRSYDLMSQEVQEKLVRGISTRDFQEAVSPIVEGTGLSRSVVSRAFVRASKRSLEQINTRDLSGYELAAIMLDGIEFGQTVVVAALGITTQGQKVLLGLLEGHTENATVTGDLLDNLVGRGLCLTEQFLAVIDGSKALRAALLKRWEGRVLIQRCQVHKKRNVIEYLPRSHQAELKRRLNAAYGMKEAAEAEKMLQSTVAWLGQISESAAASLREGMEETLTVIRLRLPELLRRSLSTTNPLESVFDGVRYRSSRVKRWRRGQGQMLMRWVAATGLTVESRLHKIRGHRLMNLLVDALRCHRQVVQKEVG